MSIIKLICLFIFIQTNLYSLNIDKELLQEKSLLTEKQFNSLTNECKTKLEIEFLSVRVDSRAKFSNYKYNELSCLHMNKTFDKLDSSSQNLIRTSFEIWKKEDWKKKKPLLLKHLKESNSKLPIAKQLDIKSLESRLYMHYKYFYEFSITLKEYTINYNLIKLIYLYDEYSIISLKELLEKKYYTDKKVMSFNAFYLFP